MQVDAPSLARELFLDRDNLYGCAETSYLVLKHAFGLPEAGDSSPAMALNGGVAYSGGMCGAISGAVLAVGQLAADRIPDHREAKRFAREIMMAVMDEFTERFGSFQCRDLIGVDLRSPEDHARFIASDVWRTVCMSQVEFVVERLATLASTEAWEGELGLGGGQRDPESDQSAARIGLSNPEDGREP